MTDTFTFTPSFSSRRAFKPQVNMMRFGDGYVQASPAGINPAVRTYELTFEKVTDIQADQIETFLADNVGQSFYWTPPGESTPSLWLCLGDYSREHTSYNVNRLNVVLEQQGVYVSPGARLATTWSYASTDWTETTPSPFTMARAATTAQINFGGSTAGKTGAILRKALPVAGDWQIDFRATHLFDNFGSGYPVMGVGVCGPAFSGSRLSTAPFAGVIFLDDSGTNAGLYFARTNSWNNPQGAMAALAPVDIRIRIYRSTRQVVLSLLVTPGGWPTLVTTTFTFAQLGGEPTELFFSAFNDDTATVTYLNTLAFYLQSAPVFTPL